MAELRCPQCETTVTSAWSRDGSAKEIICPNCRTRQPEPFLEIDRWIFPYQGRGLRPRQALILAIVSAVILLALCTGVALTHRTPLASNAGAAPDAADGGPVGANQPQAVSEPQGGASADPPQPPGGEPGKVAPSAETSGEKHGAAAQPATPQTQQSGDSTPPGESAAGSQAEQPTNGRAADGEPQHGVPPSCRLPPYFFVRQSPVCCLAASPVQPLLAFALEDGTVRLWDLRKGSETEARFKSSNRSPVGLCFHPGGHLLALLFADGWELYDIASGGLQVKQPSTSQLSAIAFSGDGKYLGVAEYKGGIVIRRLPDLSIVKERFGLPGILCLGWCDAQKEFVAGCCDDTARFWSPRKSPAAGGAEQPVRFVGHLDWISCLAQGSLHVHTADRLLGQVHSHMGRSLR